MTLSHHAESVVRILDPDLTRDALTLRTVVVDCLLLRGIEVEHWSVSYGWDRLDDEVAYVATATATIMSSDVSSELRIRIPVPCDATARRFAPPDVAIGGHDGMYVGRPLVPHAQLLPAPGLHRIWRPGAASLDLDADGRSAHPSIVLRPDLGRGIVLSTRTLKQPSNRLVALLGRLQQQIIDDHRLTEAGYVSAQLRTRLLPDLDAPPEALLDRWSAAPPPVGDALGMAHRMSPTISSRRHYGEVVLEQLLSTLAETLQHRIRDLQTAGQYSKIGPSLTQALTTATRTIVRRTGLLEPDDHTNTLARAERRRKISAFGPWGLPSPSRGGLDLRDLHPHWRGVICPVHTPESERIGLVRFAALGADTSFDTDDPSWNDVSLSAALIPFLNHDEPARATLAAKTLKQAVPLDVPERPIVDTVTGQALGESGVARAQIAGAIGEVTDDGLNVRGDRADVLHRFGPADPRRGNGRLDWVALVRPGQEVEPGDIIARAPDVVVDEGAAYLGLGANLLTALTPWYGLNFEDAIVVSQSAADRLSHTGRSSWHEELADDDWVVPLADRGQTVRAGDALVAIQRDRADTRVITADVDGILELLDHDVERRRVQWAISTPRPLDVGDKITNRHGGKGVVSVIVPDTEMPRVTALNRVIDIIANPLGVVRRLNVGQVHEMSLGLHRLLSGAGPVTVGRRIEARDQLARDLRERGAPGGRLALKDHHGLPLLDGQTVAVGPQYFVKLTHTARSKLSVVGRAGRSSWRGQPTGRPSVRDGRRVGGGQRLGEMEIWGLLAAGVDDYAHTALGGAEHGPPPAWGSVQAHLGAAGFSVDRVGDHLLVRPVSEQELEELDVLTSAELQAMRSGHADLLGRHPASDHPLHGERNGRTGADRRRLLRRIDLRDLTENVPGSQEVRSIELVHPWTGEALRQLAVLPVGYRGAPRDPIDRLYHEIAQRVAPPVPAQHGGARNARDGWKGSPWEVADLRRRIALLFGELDGDRAAVSAGLLHRLRGKHGLLHHNLLGSAQDWSARAVIVPDPELEIDEVRLPAAVYDVLVGASPDPRVMINRAPTLRPANLVCVRALRSDGNALVLHPSLLEGLAGDFDGDTVAVHRPADQGHRVLLQARLGPQSAIRSPADGSLMVKADLDLALGALLAGPTKLPRGARAQLAERVSATPSLGAVAAAQREWWSTATGWSFGLVDLERVPITDAPSLDRMLGQLAGRPDLGDLRTLAEAGCVTVAALHQLLVVRGATASFNAFYPVEAGRGCYLDGLDDAEYFHAARPSLARLAEKKLMTPQAGALTKSMVEVGYEVTISAESCGRADDPLRCRTADPCRACYGPLPGAADPPPVGAHVGILAGMLIGERSTQLAMKRFHVGRDDTIDLPELRALLGRGRSRALGRAVGSESPITLQAYLDRSVEPEDVVQVVDTVVGALDAAVDRVHVEVIVRQLVDAHRLGAVGGLAAHAENARRDPLVRATSRGSVRELVSGRPATDLRQKLRVGVITGDAL